MSQFNLQQCVLKMSLHNPLLSLSLHTTWPIITCFKTSNTITQTIMWVNKEDSDARHKLYKGILLFSIWFQSTHVNVIQFTHVRYIQPSLQSFSWNSWMFNSIMRRFTQIKQMWEVWAESHLRPHGFNCACFHETHNHSGYVCGHL
jgi:hypothetical protein